MLFNIHTILSSESGQKQLVDTLKYNFVELHPNKIEQMMQELTALHDEMQRIATLSPTEKLEAYKNLGLLNEGKNSLDLNKLNALYLSKVFNVFQGSARHYPMSHEQFLNKKAEQLKSVITAVNPSLLIEDPEKMPKLLDIGCGDCHMTRRIAAKLRAEPTGVDLGSAEDTRMWVGDVGVASQLDSDIVYYDGVHLTQALKQRTENYTELYDVITFNHVLHHYPDRNSQIMGLQQTIALLKEGGVLLFSEHAAVINDDLFELQHVLFHMKAELFSKDESLKSRDEMQEFCTRELGHYEQEKHEANYFSEHLLVRISEALGLKAMVTRDRTPPGVADASDTVFLGFQKIAPTLTPEAVVGFKPEKLSTLLAEGTLKSLEESDKEPAHRKQKPVYRDDSTVFFKSTTKASDKPTANPEKQQSNENKPT